MNIKLAKKSGLGVALCGQIRMGSQAGDVEVLYYWTSGGKAYSF
ncbi:MAG: hypothetical protein ACJAZP_000420 [Psychromonas sp.]|jgi:hypothetical protein